MSGNVTGGDALTPWQHVEIARHPKRPHMQDYIAGLFTDVFELHGDRHFSDDKAIFTAIARFEGIPVTVGGHIKGSDLNENISCNFGMSHPEGYRKFIRLAKQAEKFGRPVITFIDTPGAYPGADAEERGQGEAIARCLFELSGLEVPIIAVVIGEGGSGGALALSLADYVIIFEHAVYSVLSPEGFASILWKDPKRAEEASSVMRLTAGDLASFGMADMVIIEPEGGAHTNHHRAIEALRPALKKALSGLLLLDTPALLKARYTRYRGFGEQSEV